jgi:hypothetical protein
MAAGPPGLAQLNQIGELPQLQLLYYVLYKSQSGEGSNVGPYLVCIVTSQRYY